MTANEKKEIAKALYLNNKNINEIAKILKLSERTIKNYKSSDSEDWDLLKAEKYLSPKNQELLYNDFIQNMYNAIKEIREDNELSSSEKVNSLSKLGDSFAKMRKVATLQDPEVYRLGIIKSLLNELLTLAKKSLKKECIEELADFILNNQEMLADVTL